MSSVVIGAPSVAPPDPGIAPGWERIRSTWTGTDGSVWDLTNPEMGVFLRRGGVRGLAGPPVRHYRDELPALPGSQYRGSTFGARSVFWPVHLFHDGGSREYVERDEAWWRSLEPRKTGIWTVEVPGISKRTLELRPDGDADWAPEIDPVYFGWADYGVSLTAEQPLWRGPSVLYRFQPAAPLPFHAGDDPGAGVINITAGSSLGSAAVTNKGDEDAWWVSTLYGPFDDASLEIDGRVIEVPFSLEDGEWLRLDSGPTARTAIDNEGNDRFEDLGEVAWGAIPASSTSSLGLVLGGGTGRIEFEFAPLYYRAWGLR